MPGELLSAKEHTVLLAVSNLAGTTLENIQERASNLLAQIEPEDFWKVKPAAADKPPEK